MRVRREGERTVGEGEGDAPVTDAEPVEHVGADGHSHRGVPRCELHELEPQPAAEGVGREHVVYYPLGEALFVAAGGHLRYAAAHATSRSRSTAWT